MLSKIAITVVTVCQAIFISEFYDDLLQLINPPQQNTSLTTFKRICIGFYILVLTLMLLTQGYFIGVFHESKNSNLYGLFTKVFFYLNSLIISMIIFICID